MTRRRYRFNEETQTLEEVDADYTGGAGANTTNGAPVTDLYMDGIRATDGTDIGSRAKRRAYMRANGLADAADYTQTWAQAEKRREAIRSGEYGSSERREAIAQSLHKLTGR